MVLKKLYPISSKSDASSERSILNMTLTSALANLLMSKNNLIPVAGVSSATLLVI